MNTNELGNKKVWVEHSTKKNPDAVKKFGKIHAFVFHPNKAQLVGFLVKRPDIAWMFRREDAFVAFDGFAVMEDDSGKSVIVVKEDPKATGKGALKALGVKLDDCVLWLGLPVICENKTDLGVVDSVEFDERNGRVSKITISKGATANTLLGRRKVPASMIKGFRLGVGAKLNMPDGQSDDEVHGAIIVSDEAADLAAVGGAAESAGAASAIAIDKAKKTHSKAKEKIAPIVSDAGKAVQKGAYVTGRQIARTEGMFKNFKDEFKKAMNDDSDE